MKRLKINSDVGEGVVNEAALMPYLKSCSIACGGHYGNEETMTKTAKLAISKGVGIGAHPSYPDKINFYVKNILSIKMKKCCPRVVENLVRNAKRAKSADFQTRTTDLIHLDTCIYFLYYVKYVL